MWIYIAYIVIMLIAYYTITGGQKAYRLDSGVVIQHNRKAFSWVAGILLWSIFALRDISVGVDLINYYDRFENAQLPEFSLISIAGQEFGYDFLQYFCKSLGMSWQVYLAFVSAIIIAPMAVFFYKYSTNVCASYLLYVTIGLISVNMSALRQSLAVAMVVIAMMAMLEKKRVKRILFILLGSLFHYSALFALLLLIIPIVKYKSKGQLVLLLFIPLAARLFGGIFFGRIGELMPDRYVDYSLSELTMNTLLEVMWICILLFVFFSFRFNGKIRNDEFRIYFMTVLYVSSLELSYSIYMASRLAYYFETAVMVTIPCAIAKFHRRDTRIILSMGIYLLCIAYLMVSASGSDTLGIYNYKFFWE